MKLRMKPGEVFIAATIYVCTVTAHSSPLGGAGAAEPQVYLSCPSPTEPDGVNDLFIDFEKKVFTDFFGTSTGFREDGQYLVAEKFTERDGQSVVTSMTRVNRFTLVKEIYLYDLRVHKLVRCAPVKRAAG